MTHIICDDAPPCAVRTEELRSRAGAGPEVPLVTRAFLTKALLSGTRPDEAEFLFAAPPAAGAASQQHAPATPRDGEHCDACGLRLAWSELGRCLRCTAREAAPARALRLRYRAAHPHNRALVAAFQALYDLEVAQAGGNPERLNAAEAFSRAATVLKAAPAPLRDEEDVSDANLPYIGEKVARLAGEFLETGTMQRLEQLRSSARTVAIAELMRVPWVGAVAAMAWAADGARSAADVRAMDAAGTLLPPLPAGRALQRVAIEHAEELSVAVPREDWAPVRAVCEQVIAAVDPSAVVHLAGGYGRGRAACHDLDIVIAPREEGAELGLMPRLIAALRAHASVEWLECQHHAPPELGALAALRTEAHRARKKQAAGQSGEVAGGVTSNIDLHDKSFLLLKLRGQPVRRVDFILSARSQFAFCVLGWAGSRRFERFLRLWAADVREPALRLNSHAAFLRDAPGVPRIATLQAGRSVPLDRAQEDYIQAGGTWPTSERQLFEDLLGLPYRPAEDRDA